MTKYIKRTVYLAYYLKQLDWEKFNHLLSYANRSTSKTKLSLWVDAIISTYKYNIGLMDYLIFAFFSKDTTERSKWVGTGYKYEFDLKMCPPKHRQILEDKIEFNRTFGDFIKHKYCTIEDVSKKNSRAREVISNETNKIVVKDSLGQCGWSVEILNAKQYSLDDLEKYMKLKGFNLVESFVEQHPEIAKLSPSGLNTVRIMTMINKNGDVDILGARMRISVNNHVDNLASGNIACEIDILTGKIIGKGYYSDISKEPVDHHPITNEKLIGFQIPLWEETIETTRKIALFKKENRGVGWDIAITKDGPDYIEGNHNWCKILWQLPVQRGMKNILNDYLTGAK